MYSRIKTLRQSCNDLDKKIDVYAYGITLYEMVVRGPACEYKFISILFLKHSFPLPQSSIPLRLFTSYLGGAGSGAQIIMEQVMKGVRPPITDTFTGFVANTPYGFIVPLVQASWRQHPQDRPSFAEILAAFQTGSFSRGPSALSPAPPANQKPPLAS